MRLGFACQWGPSWELIPAGVRRGLLEHPDVTLTDLHTELPRRLQSLAWAVSRVGGHPEGWQVGAVNEALNAANLRRRVRRQPLDAVLQMGSIGRVGPPTFVYTDAPVCLLAAVVDDGSIDPKHLGYGDAEVATSSRRRRHEAEVLRGATGLFTWSAWARDAVLAAGLLPADRVHVVGAGRNVESAVPLRVRSGSPRNRLLFVGGDFDRKGGDLVVAAVSHLRAAGRDVTLTVAGPRSWPMAGPVPDGVQFAGRVASDGAALFDDHDLFVMPSRFEAYGIVFLEAQARGLPCIGSARCAMPEIIDDGATGRLLADDDPVALADLIAATLDDVELYRRCEERAALVAAQTTWTAVAARMVEVMAG